MQLIASGKELACPEARMM